MLPRRVPLARPTPIGRRRLAGGLVVLAAGAVQAAPDCRALRDLPLAEAAVVGATVWAPGPVPIDGAAPVQVAAAVCRVQLLARPTAASQIRVEVWLPASERWNGRLAGIGNPGLAGSVPHRSLASRADAGYAAVGTDAGHQGRSDDARWALGQPDKVTDYGHRAQTLAARLAKTVVAAYFGRGPERSYFTGFSNGGREALMLVQRDPSAYDGLVAGAPAVEPSRSYVLWAQLGLRLAQQPQARLTADQSKALSGAVLAACDAADGRRDGVVDEPPRCTFDPARLACPPAPEPAPPGCLSPAQLQLVRDLYDGLPSQPGERRFGGLARGSEATWQALLLQDPPAGLPGLAEHVLRHLVLDDPAWELARFRNEVEGRAALGRLAPVLDPRGTDLKAFFERGGRLILWHGWNDAVLSPFETIAWHDAVVRAVGPDLARRSMRLFLAPGVEHGSSGPGAGRFGQMADGSGDPQRSLGAALRRWVEHGIAPDEVVAVRHQVPADVSTPVVRSMLLCAWPAVARWRGSGSTDDAASYVCRTADEAPSQTSPDARR